jgi:hypothetical protein
MTDRAARLLLWGSAIAYLAVCVWVGAGGAW